MHERVQRNKRNSVRTKKDPVQRSDPVRMIVHNPYGKISADIVRMRPGAFSWNHGAVFVLRTDAQANDNSIPAMTADMNILSMRMLALATPARETNSAVSAGV